MRRDLSEVNVPDWGSFGSLEAPQRPEIPISSVSWICFNDFAVLVQPSHIRHPYEAQDHYFNLCLADLGSGIHVEAHMLCLQTSVT